MFAYGTHLVADYYGVLLSPNPEFPVGLLWPLIPPLPGGLEPRWAGPDSINVKLWTLFSAVVLLIGLARLWIVYRSASSESSS